MNDKLTAERKYKLPSMTKKILKRKYLISRRISQISILLLFSSTSFKFILKGNLSSSLLFSTIPLSDPFAYLQIFLSSFTLNLNFLLSALIVFSFYALVGGRVFCAWVCPVNLITDFALFVKDNFGFKSNKLLNLPKSSRYYLLALFLLLSFILKEPVFEGISYIGIIQRGIIYGSSAAILVALLIFIFDVFFQKRGLCSHLCPLGAFYSLSSKIFNNKSILKVSYDNDKCTSCMKCKVVCPENQVLFMVTKYTQEVHSGECLRCGRCIEVCDDDALNFNILKGFV